MFYQFTCDITAKAFRELELFGCRYKLRVSCREVVQTRDGATEVGPGIGVLVFIIVVLVLLLVGSALLRAAVSLANRTIGPISVKNKILDWDWDAEDDDDDLVEGRSELAIPEPGLGQGMAIIFLSALVNLAISFVLVNALDRRWHSGDVAELLAVHLLGVFAGYVAMLGFLAGMLPTRPGRAALAALFFYLILIALAALIFALLFLIFGA
jgi:hypothetical protein